MKTIRRSFDRLFPGGTYRREVAKRALGKSAKTPRKHSQLTSVGYREWIGLCEKKLFVKDTVRPNNALISIIVPCYNTPLKYIEPLIQSVVAQTYENWELCLADGSTESSSQKLIKSYADKNSKIKYIKISDNKGIVGNTNVGLKHATGDFVAFLDHDDTLSPHALNEVATVIQKLPDTDLIYSDEDKISDDGKHRSLPFFKPDWSPEMLLGVNYITHFVVARRSVVESIGGLRQGFDGAQDYDFLLRLTEKTDRIVHVPKILYHWRLADGSTSKSGGEKSYADDAGQRALADAVKRRKIKADVIGISDRPTNYRLKYQLPSKLPKVSIIIPFKDKSDLLRQCVDSILQKTTYHNYEVILVSNNSKEKALFDYLDTLRQDTRCKVFEWNEPFNYSAINNYGCSKATGEYYIFLNNDTEVISDEWIDELIGVASQPQIGAVGPLLRYPDNTIQHAGIILGMKGMAGHVFRNRSSLEWTDYGLAVWPRNYLAVTGACLAVSRKKYHQVGGLDEEFIIAGNDVSLCLALYEAGYRNILWPFAELYHHENASVGSYDNVPMSDFDLSLKYYRPYLDRKDPYFNMNLDLMNEQVGIRGSYE